MTTPQGRDVLQYFETQDTRMPVRFNFESTGRPAVQINYMGEKKDFLIVLLFQLFLDRVRCPASRKLSLPDSIRDFGHMQPGVPQEAIERFVLYQEVKENIFSQVLS